MGLENFDELSPELQQKLIEIEAQKPAAKQVRLLTDIADISQELLNILDKVKETGTSNHAQTGAVLLDMRESLSGILNKEYPKFPDIEIPDYAKPVVEALGRLDKSISTAVKKIDVKPEIKVDAPAVNVSPPDVDLKGIEKILRSELPKAFDKAIAQIDIPETPKADFTPVIDKLGELSYKLDSIDTASRMKPQFPNKIAVTNPDGTNITAGGETTSRYDVSGATIYTGEAPVATADSDAAWTITKYDLSANPYTGKVATGVSWTNRAAGTYS